MTRFPPMTVTVRKDPHTAVVDITVEHDVAQSFSKAVDPRAMKEARKPGVLTPGMSWTLTDAEYGLERSEERRTASRFTFVGS